MRSHSLARSFSASSVVHRGSLAIPEAGYAKRWGWVQMKRRPYSQVILTKGIAKEGPWDGRGDLAIMPASGEPHEQPSPPGELQRCVHAAGQLLRRARGRGPVVVAVWRSPKMALAATTTAGAASTTSLSDSATDSGSGRQCVSMVRCTSQADIAAAVVAEVARGSRSPRVMGRMEIRLYEAFEVEAPATLQW